MAKSTETVAEQPANSTTHPVEWPHPPAAPGWMVWTPLAAVVWAIAYGSVRVWWAIHGAPSFGQLKFDLIFFSGWNAVGLCAAAAVVALALRMTRWRWPLLIAGWSVCAALLVACPLLLLDVVNGLLPGLGAPFHAVAFASRAACLVEGILVGAAAEAYRRRWRSACFFCGRTKVREQLEKPPRWAWWAAYAAVAGCLVRLGAQAAVGFGMLRQLAGGTRLMIEGLVFEAGFLLAGTLLPLALVYSWGRVVPQWVPLLAGRRIPRWLLLGPGFLIGSLMTVYFGITIVKVAADTISGAWRQTLAPFPLAFFWVAVPGYLVWGLGLEVAALAYYRVTRPACRVCGRQ